MDGAMPANYQGQVHSPKTKYRFCGGPNLIAAPGYYLLNGQWIRRCSTLSDVLKQHLWAVSARWLLQVFPYNYSSKCKAIWENQVMWSKPSSNTKPRTKRPHSRLFFRAKQLPFPQQESRKKKRGLNKKVSSAVFRAWTDKQKKFYVCAKCNLTLQTSSIHWNTLTPRTVQKNAPRI